MNQFVVYSYRLCGLDPCFRQLVEFKQGEGTDIPGPLIFFLLNRFKQQKFNDETKLMIGSGMNPNDTNSIMQA